MAAKIDKIPAYLRGYDLKFTKSFRELKTYHTFAADLRIIHNPRQ
jgi:hypothetical protein